METIAGQLLTGMSSGAVLLLIALGLVLTFGQVGVINMAHGELLMTGAYVAYLSQQWLHGSQWALVLALPLGFAVGGLLGLLIEATVIRWLYRRPLDTLLATIGISFILQQLARNIFGAPAKEVVTPTWLSGSVDVLGYDLPLSRLFLLMLALVLTAALTATLRHSTTGRRIRATVQHRDLAEVSGVDTRTTDRMTFFIGSGLAGVAGVALTLIGATGPNLGTSYLLDAFLVVVAGGVGQIRGAVIAAFAIGLIETTVEFGTSGTTAKVVILVLIVGFLQLRPEGLVRQVQRGLL